MFQKIITGFDHKLSGIVIPEDHLEVFTEKDKLIIRIKSGDGIAVGKALLQLLKKGMDDEPGGIDLRMVKNIQIHIVAPVNLQFLVMYLAAPPGILPTHWFGAGLPKEEPVEKKVDICFQSKEAAFYFLDLVTNSIDGKVNTLQQSIPTFAATVNFTITHRMIEGFDKLLIESLLKTAENIKADFPEAQKEEIDDAVAAIITYLQRHVSFDLIHDTRHAEISDEMLAGVMEKGLTLYIPTDETTHLFRIGDVLYLIDVGNPISQAMIEKIGNDPRINTVRIISTHNHNDHTAFYKPVIQTAILFNKKVELYAPAIAIQALGAFLGRFSSLEYEILLKAGLVRKFLSDPVDSQTPSLHFDSLDFPVEVYLLVPPLALRHYIVSRGFVVLTDGIARIFTGDINHQAFPAQPLDEITGAIQQYIDDALVPVQAQLEKKKITKAQIFFDIGHFAPRGESDYRAIKKFINDYMATLNIKFSAQGLTVEIYMEHEKNNYGYRVELA